MNWKTSYKIIFLFDETSPKKKSWSALQINCDGSQIKLYKGFLLLFLESVWPAPNACSLIPQSFPFKYHFQIINLSKKNLPGDRKKGVFCLSKSVFSRTEQTYVVKTFWIGCYITCLMGKGIETQFFVPVENNLRGLLASLLHKKEIRIQQTLNLAHEYGFIEHLAWIYLRFTPTLESNVNFPQNPSQKTSNSNHHLCHREWNETSFYFGSHSDEFLYNWNKWL